MYRYLGSTDIFLYDFIGTSAFVFLLFFNIFHYKKKRNILSKKIIKNFCKKILTY